MSVDCQKICAVLYREARLLDDRQWDEWLACYAEDVMYWMPAWDDDDQLTDDHETQISLMYYPNRGGLEDRVFRIKTERSGASMPERVPATTSPTWKCWPNAATKWTCATTSARSATATE